MKFYLLKYTHIKTGNIYYAGTADGFGGSYSLHGYKKCALRFACAPDSVNHLAIRFASRIFYDTLTICGNYLPEALRYSWEIEEVDEDPKGYFDCTFFLTQFYDIDTYHEEVPSEFTNTTKKYIKDLDDSELETLVHYVKKHYPQRHESVSVLSELTRVTGIALEKMRASKKPGSKSKKFAFLI